MDDNIESIVDPKTFLPVKYSQKLDRSNWSTDEVTMFKHRMMTGHWQSLDDGTKKFFKISPKTRDILSFLYHMRRRKLLEHKQHDFPMMLDNGIGGAKVKTYGYESVRAGVFGKVKALRVEPELTYEKLVIEKGKLRMWICHKDRMICPKISIRAPLANIRIVLHQVLGPGDDFWTKVTAKKTRVKKDWLKRISPAPRGDQDKTDD